MAYAVFDTLEAVRRAHESSDLATKADLRKLELRLASEMLVK